MVTPAVCPRLLEILNTLTFGPQRRQYTVSTPCEKKTQTQRQTGLVVHMRSAMYHELSRTHQVGRAVHQRWHRTYVTPRGIYLHYGFNECQKHFCKSKKQKE